VVVNWEGECCYGVLVPQHSKTKEALVAELLIELSCIGLPS
jgi:hypothetical protein